MVGKAETMQGKKKKRIVSGNQGEKTALVCVKDRNIQWHKYPLCTTAVEPSISFHQHEEACERLYLFQVI